ncbi:uncharacterized protein LOC124452530 [Xenia sp. Carnegie-2017]|uniref:uncharacterized protein LOC124452530 n=1 Tax=Xenia sp. Carnegie-2017 TaxID=2897299 RepID=UPI001F036A67|nr:uncharacterized protein LOC124452530 [Xenia sp. Carnegie-2017]
MSSAWDFETIGIVKEDEIHESSKDSIVFNCKRYSVNLPWNEGHRLDSTNFNVSLKRLKGQLVQLKKEPDILNEYDKTIKDQLSNGVIEPVIELERADKIHYLPHHGVVRKDAKTTKVRVVYDASCKESPKDSSPNDCLHAGPKLVPLLFHILIRFREKRVALVAYNEKAFLKIAVDTSDRDCLRFLWVDDVNSERVRHVDYRFCRVVFVVNLLSIFVECNATVSFRLIHGSR